MSDKVATCLDHWTPKCVGAWVSEQGFSSIASKFVLEEVEGEALVRMNAEEFELFGLKKGPAKMLEARLEALIIRSHRKRRRTGEKD